MKKITIITGLVILLCGSLKAQDTPDPSIEVKSWQAIPGMEYPSNVIFGLDADHKLPVNDSTSVI